MNMQNLTRAVFLKKGLGPESVEFMAHWELGLDIVAVQTDDWTLEEMEGDMFNPEVNTYIDPAKLAEERLEYERTLETYGVWGFGLAQGGRPLYDTFVWGYEGENLVDTLLACQGENLLGELRARLLLVPEAFA